MVGTQAKNVSRWRPRLTRRRFLAASALAAGGVGVYTWRVEPHWIEVVERDLAIGNLPAALRDRLLVQISDLHVGDSVDTAYLIAAMKRISSLQPALTVITEREDGQVRQIRPRPARLSARRR
jgi:hypothetical protein